MKRTLASVLFATAILAAACASAASGPPATVAPQPPTPTPHVFMPVPDEVRAEVSAREALARQLGVELANISVRQIDPVMWPDSCLGLGLDPAAYNCQADQTPGFRIVLVVHAGASEDAYEVRTDQSAQTVLISGEANPPGGG